MINPLKRAKRASTSELEQALGPLLVKEARGTKLIVKVLKASTLTTKERDVIWELFRNNMETFYKCTSVFPWNPTKKRAELFHRDSRFVVIIPDGGQVDAAGLRAFTMFRFDTEEDIQGSMELVVYCYELQVAKSSQGYGLGKHLVKSLEALGQTWQMKKIMLTVLLVNSAAIQFYEKTGFTTDPISPEDEQYIILSKIIPSLSNDNDNT